MMKISRWICRSLLLVHAWAPLHAQTIVPQAQPQQPSKLSAEACRKLREAKKKELPPECQQDGKDPKNTNGSPSLAPSRVISPNLTIGRSGTSLGASDLNSLYDKSALGTESSDGVWVGSREPITPMTSLSASNFKDPALEKIAAASGKLYAELRKNPPAGRLGGRRQAFTQRDLLSTWSKSFQNNYARAKIVVSPAPAALFAFHRATEFSYGSGLDYDPRNSKASQDRAHYEKATMAVMASLAKDLGLEIGPTEGKSLAGWMDSTVSKETKMSLGQLSGKVRAVAPATKKSERSASAANLGPSGAVLRPMEKMRSKFLTDVRKGEATEKVESSWKILEHIHEAVELNKVSLLVGPSGTGKSVAIQWLAASNGVAHLSAAMKPEMGPDAMIGSYRPSSSGLTWQWGFLVKAMMNGDWVTLEEANMAPSEVTEFLNEFLNSGFLRINQFVDEDTIKTALPKETYEALRKDGFRLKPHPRFRLFLTANPDSYIGRKPLSKTLANRTAALWVPEYSSRELQLILQSSIGLDPIRSALLVENFYEGLRTQIASGHIGGDHRDKYEMNLRGLLRMAKLYKNNVALYQSLRGAPDERTDLVLMGRAVWESVGVTMRSETDRQALWKLLDMSVGLSNKNITLAEIKSDVKSIRFDKAAREVVFEDALLPVRLPIGGGGAQVPPKEFEISLDAQSMNNLYWYARRLKNGDDMLLVGETAAGKTTQVQYLHRLLNSALYYSNLSAESANEEFEGGYRPAPQKAGKFQFVPGVLERAGKSYQGKGASVFIDEFNLNPLVETFNTIHDDRILNTPEGVVKIGPETRLIGAMNPPSYQGRNMLSPALRGRFWEIWVEEAGETEATLRSGSRLKGLIEPEKSSQ